MSQHPIDKLLAVMAKLRDPDGGCPWDLAQDFKSIAPYTIEEAYEVADAIARENIGELRDELGDLLFQPVYHAQMAAEAGHFNFYDVVEGITNKMIERHPHVFGNAQAASPEDVNKIWENKKSKEQASESVLDGVPRALPALLRAKKLQSRAGRVGFEWKRQEAVLDKLEEELAELRDAVANGSEKEKAEEIGDLLFVLVNFARMNGIDAENALRECNDKFERRFRGVEERLGGEETLEDMEKMWVEEKVKERKTP